VSAKTDVNSRHVLDGDTPGRAVLHGDVGDDQSGRGVQTDRGDRLAHLHHAGLDQHGGDPIVPCPHIGRQPETSMNSTP
jgi:hypothetical protein